MSHGLLRTGKRSRRRVAKPVGRRDHASILYRSLRCEALEPRRLLSGGPPFSQMVVFGDSLSDTGNVPANVARLGGCIENDGRFTSPIASPYVGDWDDELASEPGLVAQPLSPASEGGRNPKIGNRRVLVMELRVAG